MSFPLSDLQVSPPQGYASPDYLVALGQTPLPFGATGGYLASRTIGQTVQNHAPEETDLTGAWPMFTCQKWQNLAQAVEEIPQGPVTLTLVTDPFAPLSQPDLAAIFPICRPLHDHWIIDLSSPPHLSNHHRRKLRQTRVPRITVGTPTADLATGWAQIYAHLVAKKHIHDARAFSAESLTAQLRVPGAQVVTAWDGDTLLGVDLYYLDRGRAFAHLSAYAPQGYAASVSYPMLAAAMEHLRPLADAIDLGGAPDGTAGPGIAQFKAGWTPLTRPSHLCGKVLNTAAYARLAPGAHPAGWFPAYRSGEYKS